MFGAGWFIFELHAQPPHVDIHNFDVPEVPLAPDLIQNLLPPQRGVGVVEKKLKDLVFHLGQLDCLAVFGEGAALGIEYKRSGSHLADHRGLCLFRRHRDPAMDRIDPRDQFGRGERFGDIIIRAEGKDGITNLITIYAAATGKTPEEVEAEFAGQGYGAFKPAVGEAVAELLRPVRETTEDLLKNKDYLEQIYKEGAEQANYIAQKTLDKVYRKIGFVKR